MVCRSNPASSVVIALARNGTWLDDAQVQSVFHRLRHEHDPINSPGETREQMLDRVFTRAGRQITADPSLRPQRRAGLLNRLAASASQTGSLADDTLLAMVRLQAGVETAQRATEVRLTELAGRRGMSVREARAEFIQLRAEAPGGRQPRATAPELRDLGAIPGDPATRYALAQMASGPPVAPPVRLVDQWVPVSDSPDITHIGLSERSSRVEYRHTDGTTTASAGVDGPDHGWLTSQAATGRVAGAVVARMRAAYPLLTADRAEATAYATRCDDCGRFTGDRGHHCPTRQARVVTLEPVNVSDGSAELFIAPAQATRAAVEQQRGPVILDHVTYSTTEAVVRGSVTVHAGDTVVTAADRLTRQQIDIDDTEPGSLECTACPDADGACPHIAQARTHIREHLRDAGRLPSLRVERAARTDLLLNSISVTDRPAAPTLQPTAPAVSFLTDAEALRDLIRQAGPDRQVPFMTENAFHGYAAGTTFGVELEFNGNDTGVRTQVASRLMSSGLIDSSNYGRYHTALVVGYNDQGRYSLENDCSVQSGGELITSIESDTPESWERVRLACEAITAGGGTTDYAGSHTNIGCPDYRPEDAWRLARLFRAHEDDLARCGRTPNSRRLNSYNAPLQDPGPQWDDDYAWSRTGHRQSMVNFTNAFRDSRRTPHASHGSRRIEFRFPDASHNPGTIQAQVKLAAAMTNYARTDQPILDGHQQVGTAQSQGWTNQLMASSADEWAERTHRVRWLVDTLFERQSDRVQVATLWARGRYRRA